MKLESRHWLVALLAVLVVVPWVAAQEELEEPAMEEKPTAEKKTGPEMDEGAKKVWAAWQKKEYHLSRTDLKKASFKLKIKIAHPMGEQEGTATYVWDGSKGKVTFDDPMFGSMMGQGGQDPAEMYNQWFIKDHFERGLGETKITSKTEGEETVLSVAGKNKMGLSTMRFDAEGVLRKFSVKTENPMAGEVTGSMDVSYGKVGDQYLSTGQEGTFTTAMGEAGVKVSVTNEARGDYHVPVKLVREHTMGGQPQFSLTMAFSDWKFDDDVK